MSLLGWLMNVLLFVIPFVVAYFILEWMGWW